MLRIFAFSPHLPCVSSLSLMLPPRTPVSGSVRCAPVLGTVTSPGPGTGSRKRRQRRWGTVAAMKKILRQFICMWCQEIYLASHLGRSVFTY